MRQKSGTPKVSPEQVLKDIRRATRKHYSTEDKIRIVLDGRMVCVANIASPSCAAAKGLARACTTVGRRPPSRCVPERHYTIRQVLAPSQALGGGMSNDSEGPGGGFEVWESRYSRTRLALTRRFYRALKRKESGVFTLYKKGTRDSRLNGDGRR